MTISSPPSNLAFAPPQMSNNTFDDLLKLCWAIQECWTCLSVSSCSWCPTTSACIPNLYTPQLSAPFFDPNICPDWRERWELRTCPLGCHVSTITLLTCIVSVAATFVVIGLVAALVKITRLLVLQWKAREPDWWKVWRYYQPGWWRGWRLELRDKVKRAPPEFRPLLE